MRKIAIIGSESLGRAFAYQLNQNSKNNITVFDINYQKNNDNTISKHQNEIIAKKIKYICDEENNFKELVNFKIIFLTIPSEIIFNETPEFFKWINKKTLIINLSSGINIQGESINSFLKNHFQLENIVSLKGAYTQEDLLLNTPTLFTLGYEFSYQIDKVNDIFKNTSIFLDYASDVNGIEYISSIKNAYALFFGFIDAIYTSKNTKFFVFTKSLKELRTILKFLKCKENISLLSCGIGDFGLKSTNDNSTYRTIGLLIGKNLYEKKLHQNYVIDELINTLSFLDKKLPNQLLQENLPILNSLINFFVKDYKNLTLNFQELQRKKYKIVITYGTFDLIHYGHLELLKRAKEFGDRLIVGLSTDEFNLEKGKTSEFDYKKRKRYLESLEYVDKVIPEKNWDQKIEDVKLYNASFFVMGDDWNGKFDYLREFCEVVYLPRTEDISSSLLKEIKKNKNHA